MGTCINHPDRETPYLCMKHQIYLCEDCLECRDPKIYCKHRSACPIWFMGKRNQDGDAEDKPAAAAATRTITFLPGGRTASVAEGSTLLGEAGMAFSMVDRIIISGGFGQYLDIEKAVTIGLLPDIDRAKFSYMGNSSIAGAYMALLSSRYRQEAREICSGMTYIDFSSAPRYMDAFTSALFLPHTDLEAFPNVSSVRPETRAFGRDQGVRKILPEAYR
ncbi:hypothetical protein DSCA_40990 [Desulfosarcina alkanivorans]|uniref:RACo C-terminal domain-containing protein n=1 Tax=Desulfosarcina alkanivorans TaxID=571177 RepID=A0A5K7YQJ5_9BACT|nr:ASKHA domain-containing protein [Desulfosarcina alkanivorans]BBO70169.1 hypothetical protein DSCA_40990 [Desulfosarcina alkanivorans]